MYRGYLIKKGNEVFRHDLIYADTYEITPNQRQDKDSYVDGDGVLNRTILPHRRSKIEFSTVPMKEQDMSYIRTYFTDQEKYQIEYFNPNKGIYETGTFYKPDPVFKIKSISDSDVQYDSLRIALIEH